MMLVEAYNTESARLHFRLQLQLGLVTDGS